MHVVFAHWDMWQTNRMPARTERWQTGNLECMFVLTSRWRNNILWTYTFWNPHCSVVIQVPAEVPSVRLGHNLNQSRTHALGSRFDRCDRCLPGWRVSRSNLFLDVMRQAWINFNAVHSALLVKNDFRPLQTNRRRKTSLPDPAEPHIMKGQLRPAMTQ